MTRKDFILLANAMKSACPEYKPSALGMSERDIAVWSRVVDKVTQALESTNPAFDAQKFIRACMPEEPKGD